MGLLRVVVADDSAVIRAGVEALLGLMDEVRVLSAASLDDLDRVVDETFTESGRDDLVITDIRMPPTNVDEGIRAAVRLRTTHPWVGVLVLSQFADPVYLSRLIEGGAQRRGYLLKDHIADPGELATAIEVVRGGGSFVDRSVADLLVDRRARQPSPVAGLTRREIEILAAVATGRSNAAIAASLFVTHRAVEKHINSIFHKLGLTDDRDANRRVQAVLAYLDAGSA